MENEERKKEGGPVREWAEEGRREGERKEGKEGGSRGGVLVKESVES